MTNTIDSLQDLPYDVTDVADPAPVGTDAGRPARTGRPTWPLFGVAAAITGFASPLAVLSSGVTEEQAATGADVIDTLERGNFHVGFVLGLISVGCMFVAAAGFRRWLERRAPDHLASRVVPNGLTAVATVNIVFTALAGSMALYLPGGTDNGWLSKEAMFVNFTLLDFGSLIGWWGAMVAAVGMAVLGLGRSRTVPRWMGVVSAVLVVPPVAIAVVTGLPGLVGFFGPIWLTVISIGLVFSRTADA